MTEFTGAKAKLHSTGKNTIVLWNGDRLNIWQKKNFFKKRKWHWNLQDGGNYRTIVSGQPSGFHNIEDLVANINLVAKTFSGRHEDFITL